MPKFGAVYSNCADLHINKMIMCIGGRVPTDTETRPVPSNERMMGEGENCSIFTQKLSFVGFVSAACKFEMLRSL